MRSATQAERMKAAGRLQVLLWLSAESKQRLERLAVAYDLTQVGVVEAALLAFEAVPHEQRPAGDETSAQIDAALLPVIDRVEALESALAALKEQVASLYRPEPEGAEIPSCALTEALPEPGMLEADETADDDVGDMVESPKPNDLMEKESTPINLPSLDLAVLELAKQGFGPTEIAKKLNDRGYRTESGNLIGKGHGTIKRVRDQVMKQLGR